jgi:CDP-diacylglycerol--glycerol-3-phosphate 3-phosphatidyltransferase
MALGAFIFILLTRTEMYWIAFVLFFIASITDYFDGYLARKYNATSQIGEILDPIADKILVLFVLFGLAINLSSYLIGFIGAIIITREIWVGALRDLNARNGITDATKVTFLAKIKTTVQLFTLSIYLFGLAINNMLIIVIADILLFISLVITLYTGLIYTLNTLKTDEKV